MQFQADVLGVPVDRPAERESTALGAAFLAGLAVGFWQSQEEIEEMRQVDKIFEPKMILEERDKLYRGWLRAVDRARDWIEH